MADTALERTDTEPDPIVDDETYTQFVTLGKRYADEITGFRGIATAVCDYLHGVRTVRIEGATYEGKPFSEWIDEPRLVAVPDSD